MSDSNPPSMEEIELTDKLSQFRNRLDELANNLEIEGFDEMIETYRSHPGVAIEIVDRFSFILEADRDFHEDESWVQVGELKKDPENKKKPLYDMLARLYTRSDLVSQLKAAVSSKGIQAIADLSSVVRFTGSEETADLLVDLVTSVNNQVTSPDEVSESHLGSISNSVGAASLYSKDAYAIKRFIGLLDTFKEDERLTANIARNVSTACHITKPEGIDYEAGANVLNANMNALWAYTSTPETAERISRLMAVFSYFNTDAGCAISYAKVFDILDANKFDDFVYDEFRTPFIEDIYRTEHEEIVKGVEEHKDYLNTLDSEVVYPVARILSNVHESYHDRIKNLDEHDKLQLAAAYTASAVNKQPGSSRNYLPMFYEGLQEILDVDIGNVHSWAKTIAEGLVEEDGIGIERKAA